MRATKRYILRKSVTVRKNNRYCRALFGPTGSIITNDLSGNYLISEIPEEINISGCDWRGALSIYYHMNPSHKSICDESTYFFMLPDGSKINGSDNPVKPNNQAVFISVFHHVYTLLLRNYYFVPPFNSSINTKFEILKNMLLEGGLGIGNISEDDLNRLIITVQESLQYKCYNSWAEFKQIILDHVSLENRREEDLTIDQRLGWLSKRFNNAEEILILLMSPIDEPALNSLIIEHIVGANEDEIRVVCQLLMKKLDAHSIFFTSDVEPLEMNWLKELDIIIKKSIK
jgi:hypothetical protein